MLPMDSSTSASSPFSSRSTIASSPETQSEQNGQKNGQGSSMPPQDLMQGMQGLMYNGFNPGSFQNFTSSFPHPQRTSPPVQPPPNSHPFNFDPTSSFDSRLNESRGSIASAPESAAGSAHHGGTRSEPPKRKIEVEGLPVVMTSGEELAKTAIANRLFLQGDPQTILKQRVETAIRVIIDLVRQIPASPSSPRLHPSLLPFLLRDGNGNILTTMERLATFRSIRLQAGTTTKASSKKQLQAGPTPKEHLLYLETAVYMSGDNGRRVYACKRCRMREAKRRQSKDAARKKQHSNSESESSVTTNKKPSGTGTPPSQDYITGENPEQYDPHRSGQQVEEPSWDPHHPDWRHEIVLFNSPPEVQMKDGSCVWLPFRVICYGKCHGEKVGFKVKFTLRTNTGAVIASATTNPIRITDDHKTDAKTKPRVEGMTSSGAQQAVPRARKGRASVASSRRVSPAPSDVESVQSVSEAGAVMQKQTPSVRAGKPYERPPSQSPLNPPLSMEPFPGAKPLPMDPYNYQRTQSSASTHSAVSGASLPQLQQQNDIMSQTNIRSSEFPMFERSANGTISPGSLRQPNFDFTSFNGQNGHNSNVPSVTHSATSSNVASPVSLSQPLDTNDALLFSGNHQSPTDLMSALNFSSLNNYEPRHDTVPPPMLAGYPSDGADIDMSNAISSGLDNIFDTSSHASLASSFNDAASSFSANLPEGSLFSDSGVVPEDMQGFLDFTGGEGDGGVQALNQPNFYANSPLANTRDLSPQAQMEHDRQIEEMLNTLAQQNQIQHQQRSPVPVPPPQPAPNAPLISTIIPAEGPMAGGTTVAIIGANFTPGLVVLFGDRTAKIQRIDPTFIQCQAPPAAMPGLVEVMIAGAIRMPGASPSLFKYNMMDTDLMMLALQVKGQYAGSSSDAAYRLAQQIAGRSSNPINEWSDHTNSSPSNFGPSPQDSGAVEPTDLQTTVINFLAALDVDAPGSLRRSGAINHKNDSQQTLLHIATIMGFHRLVRRLVVIGAHLDIQDVNGYTALGLASLAGQTNCVRVLIEAGASYDRPTIFGEMPLDLAKVAEHVEVEALLLSAVWSTDPEHPDNPDPSGLESLSASSEIDEDNPSDASDDEDRVSTMVKPKKQISRTMRGKQRVSPSRSTTLDAARKTSPRATLAPALSHPQPVPPPLKESPLDDPPPYDTLPSSSAVGGNGGNWMSRTLSNPGQFKLPMPEAVYNRIPVPISSLFGEKPPAHDGWIAFSAPSWESLTRLTSPEEVKLFTQAMAAAAFNAVVQSGATTSAIMDGDEGRRRGGHRRRRSSRSRSDGELRDDDGGSPGKKIAKQVKRDRMLYLFWLPILLFVGFWLLVTALPLVTGISLIYGRQIFRAVKQRIS